MNITKLEASLPFTSKHSSFLHLDKFFVVETKKDSEYSNEIRKNSTASKNTNENKEDKFSLKTNINNNKLLMNCKNNNFYNKKFVNNIQLNELSFNIEKPVKKIFINKKMDDKIEDTVKKTINKVNLLIDKKNLHFNVLWTMKIDKEEFNYPNKFKDSQINSELNSFILYSIVALAKYINDLFNSLNSIKNNQAQIYENILVCLSSLNEKIKILCKIKVQSFKIYNKDIKELLVTQKYLEYMYNSLGNELSTNILDIKNNIQNFLDMNINE